MQTKKKNKILKWRRISRAICTPNRKKIRMIKDNKKRPMNKWGKSIKRIVRKI